MKIVSVFLLCSSLVFALPFKLNTKDVSTIKKAYESKKITTRLLRYKDFLEQINSAKAEVLSVEKNDDVFDSIEKYFDKIN